jgi:hypothetical protein
LRFRSAEQAWLFAHTLLRGVEAGALSPELRLTLQP